MAKTCRTCAARSWHCLVWRCEVTSGMAYPCRFWSKRETSLLVDELAGALYWLINLHHYVSKGGTKYPVTDTEWKEALDAGMRVHARYDKEVGDA